jgi:hypothetical protein
MKHDRNAMIFAVCLLGLGAIYFSGLCPKRYADVVESLIPVFGTLFIYAALSADAEKPNVDWRKIMEAENLDEASVALEEAEAEIDRHKAMQAKRLGQV